MTKTNLSPDPSTVSTVASSPAKYHSARKRTLIIVVGALCVLLGTTVVAYAYFWYQSPEKVVADALVNAASRPAASYDTKFTANSSVPSEVNVSYVDNATQVTATIHTNVRGNVINTNGSAIISGGNYYLKITNLSSVIGAVVPGQIGAIIDTALPSLAQKIDGQWIMLTPSDIGSLSDYINVSRCDASAVSNAASSQTARLDLAAMYLKHSFLKVTQTNQAELNNGVYHVAINDEVFDAFITEAEASKTFSVIQACKDEFDDIKKIDVSSIGADLTIDRSTRTLTHATVTINKKSIDITPSYGNVTAIGVPKTDITLDTIQQGLIQSYIGTLFR